jgi:hypothetical protein
LARDPEWLRHSTRLTLDRAGDPLSPSPVGSAPRCVPGAGRHCVNFAAFRADLAHGANGANPAFRCAVPEGAFKIDKIVTKASRVTFCLTLGYV